MPYAARPAVDDVLCCVFAFTVMLGCPLPLIKRERRYTDAARSVPHCREFL